MGEKLTRRQLAAAVAAASAAAVTSSQAQQPSQPDPLTAARQEVRESLAKMEEFDLPISVQPAFRFEPF